MQVIICSIYHCSESNMIKKVSLLVECDWTKPLHRPYFKMNKYPSVHNYKWTHKTQLFTEFYDNCDCIWNLFYPMSMFGWSSLMLRLGIRTRLRMVGTITLWYTADIYLWSQLHCYYSKMWTWLLSYMTEVERWLTVMTPSLLAECMSVRKRL